MLRGLDTALCPDPVSRGLDTALTDEAIGLEKGEAACLSDTRSGHGRAPENAGHLTTAFTSGRFDLEASSESQASTVDRADRWLSWPIPSGCRTRSCRTIKGEYSMSTGRASCWSLSSSAAIQPGLLGSLVALCPAGWPQGSACQAGRGC